MFYPADKQMHHKVMLLIILAKHFKTMYSAVKM